MDSTTVDAADWLRIVAGDEYAFGQVYRRHAQRVFQHCYRRTLSLHDSEDLTAEVFAQAWRRRAEIHVHETAGVIP